MTKAERCGWYALRDLEKFRACLTMRANGRTIKEQTIEAWVARIVAATVLAAHAAGEEMDQPC